MTVPPKNVNVCQGGHWELRGKQNFLFPVGQFLSVALSLTEGGGVCQV